MAVFSKATTKDRSKEKNLRNRTHAKTAHRAPPKKNRVRALIWDFASHEDSLLTWMRSQMEGWSVLGRRGESSNPTAMLCFYSEGVPARRLKPEQQAQKVDFGAKEKSLHFLLVVFIGGARYEDKSE